MTIEDVRKIVTTLIKNDPSITEYKCDKCLIVNGKNYQIRPDEAFYYPNRIFIVEYERNRRPVESISKYHWLLKRTAWLNEGLTIHLLFIVCSEELERKYPIRTESVEILGTELSEQYNDKFNFYFINYSGLTVSRLMSELEKYTRNAIPNC